MTISGRFGGASAALPRQIFGLGALHGAATEAPLAGIQKANAHILPGPLPPSQSDISAHANSPLAAVAARAAAASTELNKAAWAGVAGAVFRNRSSRWRSVCGKGILQPLAWSTTSLAIRLACG